MQVFSGVTNIMWTSLLAFLKLFVSQTETMNRQMHDMNPLGNSPKPSPRSPALCSVVPLIVTPRLELLPDSSGRQASPVSPTRDAAWMQIRPQPGPSSQDTRCWAEAQARPILCPLMPFQDLPSSLLQSLSEGKARTVCAWCERYVNKTPFHINSTSKYYQIMLVTLPAGRGLHLEIISSNWEASKVPFPGQRASWPFWGRIPILSAYAGSQQSPSSLVVPRPPTAGSGRCLLPFKLNTLTLFPQWWQRHDPFLTTLPWYPSILQRCP